MGGGFSLTFCRSKAMTVIQTNTKHAFSIRAKGRLPLPRTRPCACGFGSSRKRAPSKILRTQTLIAWLPALATEVSGVLLDNTPTTMKTGRKEPPNEVPSCGRTIEKHERQKVRNLLYVHEQSDPGGLYRS